MTSKDQTFHRCYLPAVGKEEPVAIFETLAAAFLDPPDVPDPALGETPPRRV